MKIATWNINSIKVRLGHVKDWLEAEQPDALLLQEIKTPDFPCAEFEELGYNAAFKGQKAYNGVATLSKSDMDVIRDHLPDPLEDEPARYLETDINGVRIINIYAPNGNPAPGEKFAFKLAWYDRLFEHIKTLRDSGVPFLIGGDFNIIPEARDCYNPEIWKDDALFRPEARQKFRALVNLGLTDAFRVFNQQSEQYTFWDYQAGAWPQNKGIRIDHFLCSPVVTDALVSCRIDKAPRGLEKPSDHTPVVVEISI